MNTKWKIVVLVAVTLIIGIALGAVLDRAWVRTHRRESPDLGRAGLRLPDGPAADAPGAGPQRSVKPGGPGGPGGGGPGMGSLPFTRGPLAGQFGLALMKAELKLSEEQAAKIRSFQVEFEKTSWTPASTAPPPGPEEMKKADQALQAAILKVLTEEQKEKLVKLSKRGLGGPRGPVLFP
jgi:hypothetical protein